MLMKMIGAEVDPARRRGRNENRKGEETSGLAGDGGPLGSFWWRGRDAGDGQQAGRLTQNRKEDTEKEGAAGRREEGTSTATSWWLFGDADD